MWYLLIFWYADTGRSTGGVTSNVEQIVFERESSCIDGIKEIKEKIQKSPLEGKFMLTCVKK